MNIKITTLALGMVICLCACKTTQTKSKLAVNYPSFKSKDELLKIKTPVEQLISYLEGSYYIKSPGLTSVINIRRIWDNQGYWTYSEQTTSGFITDVVDQTITHYTPIRRDSILAEEYLLPAERREEFKYGWYNPSIFDRIKLSGLEKSTGCEVVWVQHPNHDYYGTNRSFCPFASGEGVGMKVYFISKIIVNTERLGISTSFYDKDKKLTRQSDGLDDGEGFKRVDSRPYYQEAARLIAEKKAKK